MLAPINKRGARSGIKRISFIGVTIHNTGNTSKGANAISHAKYLQGTGSKTQASWHYCVDENHITQSVPEDEKAWHAKDGAYGKGNSNTVAIEICMNSDGGLLKATNKAVELTANILKRNGITTAYGYIFQHNNWSGKNCPQMIRQGIPYDWNVFVSNVDALLNEEEEDMVQRYSKVSELPKSLQREVQELINSGALKGDEKGNLNITEDMARCLIINKRYAEKLNK